MKAIGILPTVIYELDIPHEIYSHLVELCNTINWSKSSKYTGGAVSVDMLESSYPTWRWWVEEQLNIINKNTLKDNYSSDVKINAAWMNKYKVGDYNGSHTHPWSMYSGVIFLTGDADNMVFIKPNTYNEDVLRVTNTHDVYKYPATNGKMVIFPSNLHHYVLENKNGIRHTLAFNSMPSKVWDGHTVRLGR
jgi:hypothetical protein